MNYINDCELCKGINPICSGSGSKPNYQMIRLGGICTVFIYGVKQFVKKCCLIKLYLRSPSSAYNQQKLFNIIKIKMPKFILTNDDKFMVYEIILKQEEIIIDPNGFDDKSKLEIQRFISCVEYSEQYEFITKSKFENPNINNLLTKNISKQSNIQECNNFQYIYLIQERTAVAINKPIYKIGRTTQLNFERFKSYGKGYKILLHVVCDNCIDTELKLINLFKYKYIHSTEYGNEYFEGDYKLMIKDILEIV
jgi:hypothetical protein